MKASRLHLEHRSPIQPGRTLCPGRVAAMLVAGTFLVVGWLALAAFASGESLPAPLSSSTGGARYVSPKGSDRNSGTIVRPYRTVQRALRSAGPGTTVYVRTGTYEARVELSRSGTASAPITLTAYPGAHPVFTGRLKITGSYVRVKGIKFIGGTSANRDDALIYVSEAANVTIEGSEFSSSSKSAIFVSGSSVQILGNYIHDTGTTWGQDHGIYWHHGTGGLIANNLIVNTIGYGIHLYPDADGIVVTQNTVVGSQRSGITVSGTDGHTSDDDLVVNNVVAFNKEWGIRSYWGDAVGTGNRVLDNLSFGNGDANFGSGAVGAGLAFDGNISGDPLFVDAGAGDYRLRPGSPARDRALPEYSTATDLAGRDRPQGSAADLGAFEG
jgi:hypothetical protein